jgi:hypothetical protein
MTIRLRVCLFFTPVVPSLPQEFLGTTELAKPHLVPVFAYGDILSHQHREAFGPRMGRRSNCGVV